MLEATRDIAGHDVTAGRTRVSSDHWLAKTFPQFFKQATDGPGDQVRWSSPSIQCDCTLRESGGGERAASARPRRPRPVPPEERRAVLAAISRGARDRQPESPQERFWSSTEHFDPQKQAQRAREERQDAEQREVEEAIARLERNASRALDSPRPGRLRSGRATSPSGRA